MFQSGLGDGKDIWAQVIERVPDTFSVFAYDRPGYGESPGAHNVRDPCAISRELHTLLQAASIAPPYVLVGHSLGGLDQFCFAKLYPKDVAGLVLLDPTYPTHLERMKRDAPAQAALEQSLQITLFSGVMRQEFDAQDGCIGELDLNTPLPFPTRLLFSGQFKIEEKGAFERMVRELREQWVLLFSNPQHTEIGNSGHYIQKDAPGAVVSAIEGVIDAGHNSKHEDGR